MAIYYNLKKSLIRNLIDFSITQLADGSGTSFPANPVAKQTFYRTDLVTLYRRNTNWDPIDIDTFFFDFDAHADDQVIPDNSFICLKGFSVMVDGHVISVECMVGVMIMNDTNLVKHDQVIDNLFTMLLPTKYLKIWDMSTGDEIGTIQATNGIEVMPMFKANQRPLQFVGASFLSNITVNLVSQ